MELLKISLVGCSIVICLVSVLTILYCYGRFSVIEKLPHHALLYSSTTLSQEGYRLRRYLFAAVVALLINVIVTCLVAGILGIDFGTLPAQGSNKP